MNLKTGLIIFSIVILLGIMVFVYTLYNNNMLYKDSSVYSYEDKEYYSEFPKIIHQTWKTKNLTEEQKKWQKSIRDLYPEYQYKLWDDNDIKEYVQNEFPWYYDTWEKLTPFIKKVDAVRYMWMYKIGGIYFDLDVIGKQRMDGLFTVPGAAYIPVKHSNPTWAYDTDAASPAILASYPGNPIWLYMLKQIQKDIDRPVLKCTGPIGLANLLREVHRMNKKPNIVFLSEPSLGLGIKFFSKYSRHINTGTWL